MVSGQDETEQRERALIMWFERAVWDARELQYDAGHAITRDLRPLRDLIHRFAREVDADSAWAVMPVKDTPTDIVYRVRPQSSVISATWEVRLKIRAGGAYALDLAARRRFWPVALTVAGTATAVASSRKRSPAARLWAEVCYEWRHRFWSL